MKCWLAQQKTLSECEVFIDCHLLSQEMKLVNQSAVMLALPSADGAAALGSGATEEEEARTVRKSSEVGRFGVGAHEGPGIASRGLIQHR